MLSKKILVAALSFAFFSFQDLEKKAQDFVLQTKQIEIPGHPDVFNPSIIRWKGKLLMSFREIVYPLSAYSTDLVGSASSEIGLVWLDEDFNPISKPQMITKGHVFLPSRTEDARLITIKGELYIVYNDAIGLFKKSVRMCVAKLSCHDDQFQIDWIEPLLHYPSEYKSKKEKNWVPFEYKQKMYLAYTISPHIIFQPNFTKGKCETVATTGGLINWKWGELRGGTPALRLGEEYLSFFHSSIEMASVHSKGSKSLHYFMGAYTFSASPPFQITKMSPEPIIGKNFYNGKNYPPRWKPVCAVFPCGFIMDKKYIWIAYGRQDHEIWIVKIAKESFLQSLVPVASTKL